MYKIDHIFTTENMVYMKKADIQVVVDSACNLLYASYYLSALDELSPGNWCFRNHPFVQLDDPTVVLHLIVIQNGVEKRIVIDHSNLPNIHRKSYAWCDVYGKVNLNQEDAHLSKIVAIGPLTAIRFKSAAWTYTNAFINLARSWKRIANIRFFLSLYRGQLRRPTLHDLQPQPPRHQYVFFASTIWKKEPLVNEVRANFIKACRQIESLEFEGGFAPRSKQDIPGFELLQMTTRLSEAAYMQRMAASCVVLNTPSVGGCNGWKLCEYLMMGKVILSTPLLRVMPDGFTENLTHVETDGSFHNMKEKMELLLNDADFRQQLSAAARRYYESRLASKVIMLQLLSHQ